MRRDNLMLVLGLVAAGAAEVYAVPTPTSAPQQIHYNNNYFSQVYFYKNERPSPNSYKYAFSETNGVEREEQGEIRGEGTAEEALAVHGFYAWRAPGGAIYNVTYYADETGYHPTVHKTEPSGHEGIFISGIPPSVLASLLGG